MHPELAVPASFLLAALLTYVVTPITVRVARRTSFLDVPVGYKEHRRPTPYLGGTAIIIGFIVAALVFADGTGANALILGCAVLLWLLGTIDDRRSLRLAPRVVIEVGVAVLLWGTGHGWSAFHWAPADLALTILWVFGVMNAFNLMDNVDGAAGVTAAVSSAGAGALALAFGHTALAALSFATAGACAGFLPHNLARPARSFMGDGGSLPAGFLIASVAMSAGRNSPGGEAVVTAALLVGLVILDTVLVTFSRTRGGRPVLTGGRDHLTHRLIRLIGSVRRVALILGLVQLVLCGVAVAVAATNTRWTIIVGWVMASLGVLIIWTLESAPWVERSEVTALDPTPIASGAPGLAPHASLGGPSASPSSAQAEPAGGASPLASPFP